MKKIIVNKENPNGIELDMTAEEISQLEADNAQNAELNQSIETEKQSKADLKASAKAKLIAGEPLTEEEAKTIVI